MFLTSPAEISEKEAKKNIRHDRWDWAVGKWKGGNRVVRRRKDGKGISKGG